MITAYQETGQGLGAIDSAAAELLHSALWIDLFQPTDAEVKFLAGLDIDVPSLADMEEIELSNRLYHENGLDYLTAVVPGQTEQDEQIAAPVTFILSASRLVTVRHHTPRPFQTFPQRAEKSGLGCKSAD